MVENKKKDEYVLSFYLSYKNENRPQLLYEEVSTMRSLKRCPECHAKFLTAEKDIQVCKVCGYWTKKGTARIESIIIYD